MVCMVSQLQDKLISLQQENGEFDRTLQSKSSEFDKRKDEVIALQQEVSTSLEEITSLKNQKISLQSSINDLQARHAEQKESLSRERNEFVNKLEAQKRTVQILQENIESLTKDCDTRACEVNSLHTRTELDAKHRKVIDLKKTMHLLDSELTEMKTEDLLSKVHSQSLQVRIEYLERLADKKSKEKENLKSRVIDLAQEKEDLENKYNELTAEVSNLSGVIPIYDQ